MIVSKDFYNFLHRNQWTHWVDLPFLLWFLSNDLVEYRDKCWNCNVRRIQEKTENNENCILEWAKLLLCFWFILLFGIIVHFFHFYPLQLKSHVCFFHFSLPNVAYFHLYIFVCQKSEAKHNIKYRRTNKETLNSYNYSSPMF